LHPCHPSPKLIKFCADKSVSVTAYSCLGSTDSPLYKNETLAKLAESKGKSVQQVLLVWGLQRGTSVIPKSVSKKRIEANFELDDFELSADEMKILDGLTERFKVCGQDW
jgi:glycerol 2-dehydrogenase (NADP+)